MKISLHSKQPNTAMCSPKNVYIVLQIEMKQIITPGMDITLTEESISFLWKVEQRSFQWTVEKFTGKEISVVALLIFIFPEKLNVSAEKFVWEPYDTSYSQVQSSSDSDGCELEVQVDHRIELQPKVDNYTIEASNPNTYCLLSTCYFTYHGHNTSWNSAQDFCTQHGQQLLTTKSELQATFIDKLVSTASSMALSPVIFINMKQNTHVSLK